MRAWQVQGNVCMIYVHHIALKEILGESVARLSSEQRQILRTYRHQQLQQFCFAHALPTPQYTVSEQGKPFCQNIVQLHFNHSHSQKHYALAYSLDIQNIGVDIEDLERQANFLGLAKRCFHADELAFWLHHQQDKLLWLKIWTAKEAIVKASGIGIRVNLNTINTHMDKSHCIATHQQLGQFFYQHLITEQSVITVAHPCLDNVQENKVVLKVI